MVCSIDDSTDKVSSACSTPLTGFAEAKLLALTSKALVSTAAFGRGDDVARLAFGMLVIPVKNVMQKLNDVSVRTSLRPGQAAQPILEDSDSTRLCLKLQVRTRVQ